MDKVFKIWNKEKKEHEDELFTREVDAHMKIIMLASQGTPKDNFEIHPYNIKLDMTADVFPNGMLKGRNYYKPLEHPHAFVNWLAHEKDHWLPEEVNFESDVTDWNDKLSPDEKEFLSQLFRFFTQADVDVNGAYAGLFLPNLKNVPELNMLCSGIAARESIHVHAYSQLIDTVGMDESEYQAFQDYEEMCEKHDYLESFTDKDPYNFAKTMIVYNGFVEGMQLFSSFAMLLNFGRYGKMNGMIEIVSWSLRDESMHVEAMCKVYHDFIKQYRKYIDKRKLNTEVREIAQKAVELEDKFIDLAFGIGGIKGLSPEEVKQYIRYTADYRLDQYGLRTIYGIEKNPLPWIDRIVYGKEHSNFFERRSTEYSKANVQGTINDVNWNAL
jgi:ribonucleoside-diphosphate reductase beta chain